MHRALMEKILNKKVQIGVIGIGYVGLSLAVAFAKRGFRVYGIDKDPWKAAQIKKNQSYIFNVTHSELREAQRSGRLTATPDFSVICNLDIVIICVPTPLDRAFQPDLSFVVAAAKGIAAHLKRGQMIVLESTTYPGTTEELLRPLFEKSGLKEGKDFFLAFSPERIDFGNRRYKLENTPKIIGGISKEATMLAGKLYAQIVRKVIPVSSSKCAEMVKMLENTFRFVNIGLVNEFMIFCDKMGVDVWEVVEAAKTKPYGFMPFYPGPGIGGHCIPVDPLYLSWAARRYGLKSIFIDDAFHINRQMPKYVVDRIRLELSKRHQMLKGATLLIVGVTFKKDTNDLRASPAMDIIRLLMKSGAKVSYCDPHVPALKLGRKYVEKIDLDEWKFRQADCVVIVTDHSSMDYHWIARNSKIVLDTRNALKDLKQRRHIVKL